MSGWGEAAGAIFGWFSPEQRMKQKRIKRDELRAERKRITKPKTCTIAVAKRVMEIDAELEKIERDLGN